MHRFQATIGETVINIESTEPGALSHILRDLSEYATLAFIARNLLLVFKYRHL